MELSQKMSDEPSGHTEPTEADGDKNQELDRPHSAKGARKRKKKPKAESPSGSPVPPPAEEHAESKLDL